MSINQNLENFRTAVAKCRLCAEFTTKKMSTGRLKEIYHVTLPKGVVRVNATSTRGMAGRYNEKVEADIRKGGQPPNIDIVVIDDIPTKADEQALLEGLETAGLVFHTKAQRWFEAHYLQMLGGVRFDNYYVTSLTKCCLGNLRTAKTTEVEVCLGWLKQELHILQPKLIIALGKKVTRHLLNANLDLVHGELQRSKLLPNMYILPMYKPGEISSEVLEEDYSLLQAQLTVIEQGGIKSVDTSNFEIVTSVEDVDYISEFFMYEVLGQIKDGKITNHHEFKFAFDIETDEEVANVINPRENSLAGIAVATDTKAWYIVTMPHEGGDYVDPDYAVEKLQEWTDNYTAIVHNAKFEGVSLRKYGYNLNFNNLVDTYLLGYVLNEKSLGLKALAKTHYGVEMPTLESLINVKTQTVKDANVEMLGMYACGDAWYTYKYASDNLAKLQEREQTYLYENILIPVLRWIIQSESEGIVIDVENLKELGEKYDSELQTILENINQYTNGQVNVNSGDELSEYLQAIGLRLVFRTETGKFKTDKNTLELYKDDHPVVPLLLEYSRVKKINSTYIKGITKYITPEEVIYPSVNQTATVTGRWSYSSPNLQNLPAKKDGIIRSLIVPDTDDSVIVAIDSSQIEYRVTAYRSQDKELLDIYSQDRNLHAETCKFIYQITEEHNEWDLFYKYAKNGNFARLYGARAKKISETLGCSLELAQVFLDGHIQLFSGVEEWIQNVYQSTRELGYTQTMFGYRKYLPNINSSQKGLRLEAERHAVNYAIQGSAAYINQIAIVNILKYIDSLDDMFMELGEPLPRLLLQVHDELVFSVPKSVVNFVVPTLGNELATAVDIGIPTPVDIEIGPNWYNMQTWEEYQKEHFNV